MGKHDLSLMREQIMNHPSEFSEEDRWWTKHKIVVWWKQGDEFTMEFGCGDTPEEVVDFMRQRSWIDDERNDSFAYMSGIQRRIHGPENILFYDAESFLIGLIKIEALWIEKWEWEPDYDLGSDKSSK
ncbi:MAG: hypothetical protein CMA25_07125 [Euryarchaeota archaeon]|nr:hypothetical protein [Euryarchaeota archaeon]